MRGERLEPHENRVLETTDADSLEEKRAWTACAFSIDYSFVSSLRKQVYGWHYIFIVALQRR